MILALLVFLATFVCDVFWANYAIHTTRLRACDAALWAGLIVPATGLSVIAYVKSPWYLIPSVLGAYVGTYVTVQWNYRKSHDLSS